jgi:hypothetical protein
MTTEHTYTVGRVNLAPTPYSPAWSPDYGKLVAANLAIARLKAALQRCIPADDEAARLNHEALLES